MNRLRFGALLTDGKQFAFYLSRRILLTIPEPGQVRAVSPQEFLPAKVFAVDGQAVPFFDALLEAAYSEDAFNSSFEMTRRLLRLPENFPQEKFLQWMKRHHGAVPVDFDIPVPKGEPKDAEEKDNLDEDQIMEQFNQRYGEARSKYLKRPNILVCGYTGSGKTSLAKAILGDVVPDSAIGDGRPTTMGYDRYENQLVAIWDSKGLENGEAEEKFTEETRRFVRKQQNDPNVDNHIHLVWYTIQGPGARITDCDINLIRKVFNPKHVIVVVTKADITRPKQKTAMQATLTEAGIPREQIIFTSDAESGATGCRNLMQLSYEMLPEAYRDAFLEAQRIDREANLQVINDKAAKAEGIIAAASTAAAATGAIPIPIADAAILVPIQITMIASLASLYGLPAEGIKQLALPFVAKLVGLFASSSILKLIPGLGNVVNATVAGTLTGAMGLFVANHFKEAAIAKTEGRPLPNLDFDVDAFKRFYADYKSRNSKEENTPRN